MNEVLAGEALRTLVLVGIVMAAGTLFVLDASLPGAYVGEGWVFCIAVASSVLWLRELTKLITRAITTPVAPATTLV